MSNWKYAVVAGILGIGSVALLWYLPPEDVQVRLESDLGGALSNVTVPRNHGGGFRLTQLDGSEISLSGGTAVEFRAKGSSVPVTLKDFGRPLEEADMDYETNKFLWVAAALAAQGANPPEVHAVLVDLRSSTPYVVKSAYVRLSSIDRVQISWAEADSEAFTIGLTCYGPRSCDRLVRVAAERYSVGEFEYPSGTLDRLLFIGDGRLITANRSGLTWIRPNLGWIAATARLPGASEIKGWSLASSRNDLRVYLQIPSGFFSVPVSAGFF